MSDSQTMTRAAIITGASRGIGAAVAERLSRDGLAVVINYAHGGDQAAALAEKITAVGGRAVSVKADIGSCPTTWCRSASTGVWVGWAVCQFAMGRLTGAVSPKGASVSRLM